MVAAVFRGLLVNALPENISGRTTGFEVVLVIEDRSELADFARSGGGANVEVITPLACKIRATCLAKKLGSRSGECSTCQLP